jgi:biotin carboxylase
VHLGALVFIHDAKPYLIKYTKGDVLNREGNSTIEVEELSFDKTMNLNLYRTYSKNGTCPVVMKPISGSGAKGAKLCTNEEDYLSYIQETQRKLDFI